MNITDDPLPAAMLISFLNEQIYLPTRIKAPAAIARISSKVRDVRIPPPGRPTRPIKISQILSKSIPIFVVTAMLFASLIVL